MIWFIVFMIGSFAGGVTVAFWNGRSYDRGFELGYEIGRSEGGDLRDSEKVGGDTGEWE